jgi:hypothetical protein
MKTKTQITAIFATLLFAAGLGAAQLKPYPLKECIVSGNELGSMGKVVTTAYDGQEIKLCCKPCIKKFNANPAKYLSKLRK